MKTKRPLAPRFLNKLDDYLLLHKPGTWSARAHLVWYYSLLFIAALAGICFAVPDDPRSSSASGVWAGFVAISAIIALVGWLIYLLRFNVFKRFGKITPWTSLVDFLLYFATTAVIVSFCFVPLVVESIRANRAYTSEELGKDINTINTSICKLEYDSLPKDWAVDTLRVVDTIPGRTNVPPPQPGVYEDYATTTDTSPMVSGAGVYNIIDTAELAGMVLRKDSLVKIDDSTYQRFVCPDYIFLYHYQLNEYSQAKLYTSTDIFFNVIAPYTPPDKLALRMELKRLHDKYYYSGNSNYHSDYDRNTYRENIRRHYNLREIEDSIENIAGRKYNWQNNGEIFFYSWFYCSFLLALLVFIFRRTTVPVFFLSLLTLVILFILTMLWMSFFRGGNLGFYLWFAFYFVVFAIISIFTFSARRRSRVTGIANNLFVLMLPFMPLLLTVWYYSWLDRQSSNIIGRIYLDDDNRRLAFELAQVAGPAIFLVMLVVYVHRLYRKWYASAEL